MPPHSPPPPSPGGFTPSGLSPLASTDPATIGPYRLVGRLGAGGMGVVYAAVDRPGNPTAVKTIHRRLADDPDFRSRFAREVDLVRRVRTPCAPAFLAASTRADTPWLATEYVSGPTLRRYVREYGPLQERMLTALASGVAEALQAVHTAGITHRDLKPGNIVLAPDGPKVLDFGIARAAGETALTRTGGVLGTPGWVAPELFDGAEVTPSVDVFAWGAVVAYAATGREPFGRESPEVMRHRAAQGGADLAGVPETLLPLVRAALDPDRARRPVSGELVRGCVTAHGYDGTLIISAEEATRQVPQLLDQDWQAPSFNDTDGTTWVSAPRHVPARAERSWGRRALPWVAAASALALVVGGSWYAGSTFAPGEEEPADGAAADGVAASPEEEPELSDTTRGGMNLVVGAPPGVTPDAVGVFNESHNSMRLEGVFGEFVQNGGWDEQDPEPVFSVTMETLEREGDTTTVHGLATYSRDDGNFTLHSRDLMAITPNPERLDLLLDFWAEDAYLEHPSNEDEPLLTLTPERRSDTFSITFTGIPEQALIFYDAPEHNLGEIEIWGGTIGVLCLNADDPDWSNAAVITEVPWSFCDIPDTEEQWRERYE